MSDINADILCPPPAIPSLFRIKAPRSKILKIASALLSSYIGRNQRPADFDCVRDHGELDGAGFADIEFTHRTSRAAV